LAAVLRRLLVPALVLASLVTPAVAVADYNELLKDACRDERVNGTYSQKDYLEALANIPADADQYTNCRDVLRAAQLAAARAQAAGRSGGAPAADAETIGVLSSPDPLATATPAQKQAVAVAVKTGGGPVTVAGEVVEPSTLGAGRAVAAGLSDLPTPLLASLALIAAFGVGALVTVLAPRVRDRRKP
jgi:hypothetical protein